MLETLRKYRIFDISIIDTVGTIVIAFILHKYFIKDQDFGVVLLITFLTGILAHRLFGVKTMFDKYMEKLFI